MRSKNIHLIWLVAFFLSAVCGFASKPSSTPVRRDPNLDRCRIEVPESASTESGVVKGESILRGTQFRDFLRNESRRYNAGWGPKKACELIYLGKFDAAGELLEQQLDVPTSSIVSGQADDGAQSWVGELAKIVQQYRDISQQRRSVWKGVYAERLAELEKFQAVSDTNDVNEVNDIPRILAVVAQVCEFADEEQKRRLLSESFVKQTIQKAKSRAAWFESKGKWLDAYMSCYSWLGAIDEELDGQLSRSDNEAYSDHAENLLEKANIVASLQDSPCESSEERFRGVEEKMFVRAINALNYGYVSIIDYRQMATKAIERCKLLAEVMRDSYLEQETSYPITDEQCTASLTALGSVLDEVNASLTGISKDKFIDIFKKVLELSTTTAQLPRSVLIAQFAEAALSSLDSHTVIVWPRQVGDFEQMHTGEFTGIGIEISKRKGLLTVVSLLPDTPAYCSGLDAEDVIEKVDGIETKDMTLGCAVKNIKGPAGSKVTLTVRRAGEQEPLDITITRARITVPTIRGWQRSEAGKWRYMIDEANKLGYIRITSFDERTASDFEEVLVQLEKEGLKGLVLDLRFNTGGLLDSAVEIVDKFIAAEEGFIVSTRPRFGVWTYASAHKEKTHPSYPLVVLINRYSASASEIVAGALADARYNRAILVGERTFGKGSVQGITRYPGAGAQLKYTMAYYHLPSGQRVESQEAMKRQGRKDWGVGPNIEVKLRSDELKKMFDVRRENDVLVKADHDMGGVPLRKHTVEETLAADSQLAIGVLVVKTKLIEAENSRQVTAGSG